MPSDRSHCLPALLGSQVRHRIRLNGIQIAAQAVLGHLQFEAGLEAKPELGAAAEEPREPKRGSSRNGPNAGQHLYHLGERHPEPLRQPGR